MESSPSPGPMRPGPMQMDGAAFVPAATVVVMRRGRHDAAPELLMVQRSRALDFAGGAAVFPGGRVDPGDHALAALLSPDEEPELAAARIAAIRETLEETGLMLAVREPVSAAQAARARALLTEGMSFAEVLAAMHWTLAPERLDLFAHWTQLEDRFFDTRFFVIDIGSGACEVSADETENTRLFWASAAQTLAMVGRRKVDVIFPTRCNLERLARLGTLAAIREDVAAHPVRRIHTRVEMREGDAVIAISEGLGYRFTSQRLSETRRR
ncbi:NUDIX domain-containing protein [Novosphingobium sp. 9]|uniref:NUDIX domain-containing protein n=1 Tax=Novosphingobium sp. 9 TaxID=2025349 RepID=UPI0021B5AFD9|nr:NUDIX domain-containing protein [Novosphingobium sp. 9]